LYIIKPIAPAAAQQLLMTTRMSTTTIIIPESPPPSLMALCHSREILFFYLGGFNVNEIPFRPHAKTLDASMLSTGAITGAHGETAPPAAKIARKHTITSNVFVSIIAGAVSSFAENYFVTGSTRRCCWPSHDWGWRDWGWGSHDWGSRGSHDWGSHDWGSRGSHDWDSGWGSRRGSGCS
jgi:hypothetical protein